MEFGWNEKDIKKNIYARRNRKRVALHNYNDLMDFSDMRKSSPAPMGGRKPYLLYGYGNFISVLMAGSSNILQKNPKAKNHSLSDLRTDILRIAAGNKHAVF